MLFKRFKAKDQNFTEISLNILKIGIIRGMECAHGLMGKAASHTFSSNNPSPAFCIFILENLHFVEIQSTFFSYLQRGLEFFG